MTRVLYLHPVLMSFHLNDNLDIRKGDDNPLVLRAYPRAILKPMAPSLAPSLLSRDCSGRQPPVYVGKIAARLYRA